MRKHKKNSCKIILLITAAAIFSCTKQNGITPNWPKKADLPGSGRQNAVAFTIGDNGYIGTGAGTSRLKDFWQYDAASNTWNQKADFGGTSRYGAVGFSVDGKGYIGLGYDGTNYKTDMWEYDVSSNSWVQKLSFPSNARDRASAFVIGNKAYVGIGGFNITSTTGIPYKDFWEFSPDSNLWKQKADFSGSARYNAIGFSVGNKGYIGTGFSNQYETDFYEYDAASNTWNQKASYPVACSEATSFVIGTKAYVGTGYVNNKYGSAVYEYDPAANVWTKKSDFPGIPRADAIGFSVNGHGYIGTGLDDYGDYSKDMFEYFP